MDLGAQEALLQRGDGLVHQRKGNPLARSLSHDRAVVRGVGGEGALARAAIGLAERQRDRLLLHRAGELAIAIGVTAARSLLYLFGKFIDVIDPA